MIDNTKFLSFEGIDFSGKTTQIDLLTEQLKRHNQEVVIIREPGGTVISEKIRQILLDKNHHQMTDICEVFLYSAARNQIVSEKISKELAKGKFVLADRFVDSTTAYQGFGRRLPMNLIKDINQAATGGLLPSLTFFLDINPDEVMERIKARNKGQDRLESAGNEFYQRVYKGYHKIAELDRIRVKIINARNHVEEINTQIWEFVSSKLDFNL